MAKPFKGVISLDVRDSIADWGPYLAEQAPEGAPNVRPAIRSPGRQSRW
jgi:arylsulfatase